MYVCNDCGVVSYMALPADRDAPRALYSSELKMKSKCLKTYFVFIIIRGTVCIKDKSAIPISNKKVFIAFLRKHYNPEGIRNCIQ